MSALLDPYGRPIPVARVLPWPLWLALRVMAVLATVLVAFILAVTVRRLVGPVVGPGISI